MSEVVDRRVNSFICHSEPQRTKAFFPTNGRGNGAAAKNLFFQIPRCRRLPFTALFCRIVCVLRIVRNRRRRHESVPIMSTPQALPCFGSCQQSRTLWTAIDDNLFAAFLHNSFPNAPSECIRPFGKRRKHIWVFHLAPTFSKECSHLVACVFGF